MIVKCKINQREAMAVAVGQEVEYNYTAQFQPLTFQWGQTYKGGVLSFLQHP